MREQDYPRLVSSMVQSVGHHHHGNSDDDAGLPYAHEAMITLVNGTHQAPRCSIKGNGVGGRARFGRCLQRTPRSRLWKPKPAAEEKDNMDARIASMSREERLAEMTRLLEPMRQYLPPGEDPGPTVVDGEAGQDLIRCQREDRGDT
jgi:hypothetical protein